MKFPTEHELKLLLDSLLLYVVRPSYIKRSEIAEAGVLSVNQSTGGTEGRHKKME